MEKQINKSHESVEHFDSLVQNAFYFLAHSIQEFNEHPKFSLINFCAATEQFLKARLMKEHWSLILQKPQDANLDSFKQGDFISVTPKEAIERIKSVSGDNTADKIWPIFSELIRHRNKLIHFYHKKFDDKEERQKILILQCRSWYLLQGLFKEWNTIFSKYDKKILEIEKLMENHQKYLHGKYLEIKPNIEQRESKGEVFIPCMACGFQSVTKNITSSTIHSVSQCLVCNNIEDQYVINCPDEECTGKIFSRCNLDGQCEECAEVVNEDNAIEAIEQHIGYFARYDQGEECDWIANCTECDSMESVIKLDDDVWYCVKCFTLHDIATCCGYCNEWYTGDNEDSYTQGCGFCDGYAGYQMSKND